MNDQARKLLAFVIHHYGVDVIQTPKHLLALLKDHAKGQFKPEISLFMQAVTEGLVIKLLTHQYASVQALSARAIKHLQEDCFIEKQAAHWVIDSWCIALKLARPIPIHTTPAPDAQAKPSPVTVIKSPVLPPMPTVQATPVPATQGTSSRKPLFFLLFLVVVVFLVISNKPDKAPAIASTPKAAEQGDAKAQTALGLMYAKGQGVTKDDAQAVTWFRKAAEQGDAEAQFNLGLMYAKGRGVTKDDAQAVTWYRKSADQGYAEAQFNLGLMYAHGQGVTKDDAQAVTWYRKAAKQGYALAQFGLGFMYEKGQGVAQDDAQAVTWYRKAAVQGNTYAQRYLENHRHLTLHGIYEDVMF
jgi:hypothetical protein